MAEETTISTPVETTAQDTSTNVEPEQTADTSTVEPEAAETTAGTETNADAQKTQEEQLLAGKFKTQDDLIKGYKNAAKFVTKAAELEKELNAIKSQKAEEVLKAQNQRQQQAQMRGFKTAEQAEIADTIRLKEFEYYANNINSIDAENYEQVRQNLLQYYNTGNPNYLAEAKRYYSSDFIENAAREKIRLESYLNKEYLQKAEKQKDEDAQKLAQVFQTDFKEFLGDLNNNQGKNQALKMFCNADFINSKEDMQTFQEIYSNIAKYEREQAVKEYEAQKAIENTKQGAAIEGTANGIPQEGHTPTYEEIAKMSQSEFNAACEKYGLDKIISAK